ncbi:MAG: N-acetyl-gamma-glutamyl-phosphate reductase [Verrucomicrobia bacterium]|nr:N-acetyl-gamma-glutamyl-phosphate reductase [Verrucomicrobiota bacterium]
MKVDAVIFGASGYGGGELLYWLSRHPHVQSVRGTSRQRSGEAFWECHPNLRGIVDGCFESCIPWDSLAESEQPVVFSALPHGELKRCIEKLELAWSSAGLSQRLLVIDLSADFRAGPFTYGLPEWNRAAIQRTRRIASPGCFATALQLALLPLRGLDLGFIASTAVTGSSGSGASASAATHHPVRANDFRAYKVLSHQHLSEVRAAMLKCEIRGELAFVPQSGPFVRGIFATAQFRLPDGLDAAAIEVRTHEVFDHEPFVRIVEESPRVAAVAGTNFADIAVAADENSAVVLVAIDNLGKGMAGQAVQAMNIALGLDETLGLWQPGRFPV